MVSRDIDKSNPAFIMPITGCENKSRITCQHIVAVICFLQLVP